MTTLHLVYLVSAGLMIALPLVLGFYLTRRLRLGWLLYAIGGATFVGSQMVHIPLLGGLTYLFYAGILPPIAEDWRLIFNATVLGLASGLCEESARALVLYFWLKSVRSWREAVLFGAGHGGVEAIIMGIAALTTFIQMAALQGKDLSALGVPADQQALIAEQLVQYWSGPWYLALIAVLERCLAICLHLGLAVLVMQAFLRQNILWVLAAMLWHAAVNGLAVYVQGLSGSYYWTEAVVAAFALLSLVILFRLRTTMPTSEPAATVPAVETSAIFPPLRPDSASSDQAEDSKYFD